MEHFPILPFRLRICTNKGHRVISNIEKPRVRSRVCHVPSLTVIIDERAIVPATAVRQVDVALTVADAIRRCSEGFKTVNGIYLCGWKIPLN